MTLVVLVIAIVHVISLLSLVFKNDIVLIFTLHYRPFPLIDYIILISTV